MNQVSVLLNHLVMAKSSLSEISMHASAKDAWMEILELTNEHDIAERMNLLSNTALQLCKQSHIESELDGNADENFDTSWLSEVLRALSLYGNFADNIGSIHNHTYNILRANIRSWDRGYTIQTNMDQEKINDLISKFKVERDSILSNEVLSFDLRKLLLIEIDKIIFSLENLHLLGEENLKNNVTDFYANAFFNKDIQAFYYDNLSFKEILADLSAAITIGTFAGQSFTSLVENIGSALPFIK